MVLEVKPLADSQLRRVLVELVHGEFRSAILAHESHVEVAIVCRTLGFAMARGGRPGAGQVVQAVPMDPLGPADQQLSSTAQAELLDFFRAEAGDADFRD